jgi:hypothetical protein
LTGWLSPRRLSSRQPRRIPWTGIIDRSRSKIFCPKRSTDPSFKTAHAKETAFHSGRPPQLVADHVILRATLTSAAAFAGAWHCVHTAIFTVVGRCFSAHYAGLRCVSRNVSGFASCFLAAQAQFGRLVFITSSWPSSSSGTKPQPPHVGHCCSSSVPFSMTPSPLQSGQVFMWAPLGNATTPPRLECGRRSRPRDVRERKWKGAKSRADRIAHRQFNAGRHANGGFFAVTHGGINLVNNKNEQ